MHYDTAEIIKEPVSMCATAESWVCLSCKQAWTLFRFHSCFRTLELQSQHFFWVLQAFAKQEVQAAIMDCTQNPMNIINYQNNPDIMMVSHLSSNVGHVCMHTQPVCAYVPALSIGQPLWQTHAAACLVFVAERPV